MSTEPKGKFYFMYEVVKILLFYRFYDKNLVLSVLFHGEEGFTLEQDSENIKVVMPLKLFSSDVRDTLYWWKIVDPKNVEANLEKDLDRFLRLEKQGMYLTSVVSGEFSLGTFPLARSPCHSPLHACFFPLIFFTPRTFPPPHIFKNT